MKKFTLCFLISLLVMMGGCKTLKNNTSIIKENGEEYVRVQDYNGEGYTVRGGREEAAEIAELHRDEVEKAVKEYFLENYYTEVKVNNFIGAKDAVSVTVEAVGEPFFYTFAIVPVDFRNKTVDTDGVWTLEGEVEKGIKSGLYVMSFEEEFLNLDRYIEELKKIYPIVGKNKEAIQNTNITRAYATPHYFVSLAGETFKLLFAEYMKNPNMNKSELQLFFKNHSVNPENINISLDFFMRNRNAEPDKNLLDKISGDIENMSNIPMGSYSIYLNDNYIIKHKGTGRKNTTLSRRNPSKIIKNNGKE